MTRQDEIKMLATLKEMQAAGRTVVTLDLSDAIELVEQVLSDDMLKDMTIDRDGCAYQRDQLKAENARLNAAIGDQTASSYTVRRGQTAIDDLVTAGIKAQNAEMEALLQALIEVTASLAWNAHGECRAVHDGPIMPSSQAVEFARAAIRRARGEA